MPTRIRRKYDRLYENDHELIYVHFEDLHGYIYYEYCDDCTKQIYRMTLVEFLNFRQVITFMKE